MCIYYSTKVTNDNIDQRLEVPVFTFSSVHRSFDVHKILDHIAVSIYIGRDPYITYLCVLERFNLSL